jgi:hypothetical protein
MPTVFVLFLTLACHPKNGDECDNAFYADADGDGHGDPGNMTKDCDAPGGFTDSNDDCDDANAAVYPGADEICDGLANGCEGKPDVDAIDPRKFYLDTDGDGYGVGEPTLACERPDDHYVGRPNDCDDADAAVNPDAIETCNGFDDDCDERVDDEDDDLQADDWFADVDGDHYGDPATQLFACDQPEGYVGRAFDCDDTTFAMNPEAIEICDGLDNDCDGLTDTKDGSLTLTPYYPDNDGDGYGDPAGKAIDSCDPVKGHVADDTDCDDNDKALHEFIPYYVDLDGDGWGNDDKKPIDRCVPAEGEVALHGDCDDANPSINPGMPELCASGDENCNDVEAEPDPAIVFDVWYADVDGDGHGDPSVTLEVCNPPDGYVMAPADDCDDSDRYVYPGALEVCDGIDNDCNKVIEDTDSANWFADTDGDGYGNAASFVNQCAEPSGYVRDDTDCDDGVTSTNPGAADICANGVDDDCDESTDNCLFDINDAGFVFQGDQLGQGLGLSMRIGNFDGKGDRDDILMGSKWAEKDNGEVYVVAGPMSGSLSAADAVTIAPGIERNYFGSAIGAGDANDDGVDDALVAPFLGAYSYLFLGPITSDRWDYEADAQISSLTPIDLEVVGDFDGDGGSDFVVVADNTYVLSGTLSGTVDAMADATYEWSGGVAPGGMPIPILDVERMGDMDGDGIEDLVMGSTQATEGVVWIVPGGLAGGTYLAQTEAMATIEAEGEFASCIVTADYDEDGLVDLIADAPEVSESSTHDHFGAVYGFFATTLRDSGGKTLSQRDADTDWESAGGAGKQMATGDFDGDGHVDLAMGNPYGEYAQGFVFVDFNLSDAGGKTIYDTTLLEIPGLPNEWHGTSLGTVSDWSGDGADDLVIGAQALGAVGLWGAGGNGGAYVVYSEDLYAP